MRNNRRTVVLALGAAVAVTAAVVATVINHKSGGESKQRKAVSAYVQQVNDIQSRMGIQLVKVRVAYGDLNGGAARRKRAGSALGSAAVTLTKLERRLVATPAPAEATKLRSLLVKLVSQEVALTRELHELSVFSPRFSVLLKQLQTIDTHFNTSLRAVPRPKLKPVRGTKAQVSAAESNFRVQEKAAADAQASAIDVYIRALTGLSKRLATLHPPAVVAPGFAAEVRSLHDVTVTGAQLSAALRAPSAPNISARIRAFTLAGREAVTLAAQRTEIAAIRAYNARSHAVRATTAAVQAELRRLGRELP